MFTICLKRNAGGAWQIASDMRTSGAFGYQPLEG
jgi:hypothetical protein